MRAEHSMKHATLLALALFVLGLGATAASVARAEGAKPTAVSGTATTEEGDEFRWGVALSAVRFRVSRDPDRPGRERLYAPDIRGFSGQFGFQFAWLPPGDVWRMDLRDDAVLQLFSIGFMVIGEINADRIEQSDLSLAFTLGFLNNTMGLGVGIDLYRGVPILGADGSGTGTAYTGLMSHILASEGEMTGENVVALLYINVVGLVQAISGDGAPSPTGESE